MVLGYHAGMTPTEVRNTTMHDIQLLLAYHDAHVS
jgi:hypothetical protein